MTLSAGRLSWRMSAALGGVVVVGAVLGASAADTVPAATVCHAITDPAGDDNLRMGQGGSAIPVADPNRDITAVDVAVKDGRVVTTIAVQDLSPRPQTWGDWAALEFRSGASQENSVLVKVIRQAAQAMTAPADALEAAGTTWDDGVSITTHTGTAHLNPTDADLRTSYDMDANKITFSFPAKIYEQYTGTVLDDAPLTKLVATTGVPLTREASLVFSDEANAAAYTVGYCESMRAAHITYLGARTGQYGDRASASARLTTAKGKAVVGKSVDFVLGPTKVSATTNGEGIAVALLTLSGKAGRYTLESRYAPVDGGPSLHTSTPFTIVLERTRLKAVRSGGGVTAALTDDDAHPLGGQMVTFTAEGKKTTVKTDAKGVARLAQATHGTTVQVNFAGASGTYDSSAASVKV
jgi:hypothetical protein